MPYYPRSPEIEAAKHLRLVVGRYIANRASMREIEEAMVMLRQVAPVAGDIAPKNKHVFAYGRDGICIHCNRPEEHAISWERWWGKAKGEPRKLGDRRVSLPLFPDEAEL